MHQMRFWTHPSIGSTPFCTETQSLKKKLSSEHLAMTGKVKQDERRRPSPKRDDLKSKI